VVVGSVTAVQEIGRARGATQDRELLIQLTLISLNVETVIRGDIPSGKFDFHYYTFSNQNRIDLARRFEPRVGDRRVFFIQAFNGGHRSVGDVTDYTIAVKSGFHSRDFCLGEPLGNCISRILLTPGKVYDSEAYALNLRKATSTAELIGSGELAFQLLQQLSKSTDPKVAAAAQRVLRGELTR
jgi:hypothetical protein